MLPSDQKQALHKSHLFRLLMNILDDSYLANNLIFKGGTCASMQDFLNRFSVDLDFDIKDKNDLNKIQQRLEQIFDKLNLEIKDKSGNTIQYFLRYQAPTYSRNTLKIEAVDEPLKDDQHEKVLLTQINRFAICQTIETMFAHKLVAMMDRYHKNKAVAGRDLYDIHHYLQQGYSFLNEIIEERTQQFVNEYLQSLVLFIEQKITQKIIDQDLNYLLDYKKFKAIRFTLKDETLLMLRDRIADF